MSAVFRGKARDVVVSIDAEDIAKATLQQKSISSGILLDKSLLLSGEPTMNLNIGALLDVCDAIRQRRDEESERYMQEFERPAHCRRMST